MRSDRNAPLLGPDSNEIVMSRHRTDARFPHIATVETYWHALSGTVRWPRRAEVDPRGIENALECAFILEQNAPGIGRMRIAGGHLGDLLGMEVRGMPLSAFYLPEARDDLAAYLEKVCADPTIATLTLQAEPGIGKSVLDARLFLLPLCDEAGEVNRILGCLDSNGSIGRAPRRFSILSRRLTQISGTDVALLAPPEDARTCWCNLARFFRTADGVHRAQKPRRRRTSVATSAADYITGLSDIAFNENGRPNGLPFVKFTECVGSNRSGGLTFCPQA